MHGKASKEGNGRSRLTVPQPAPIDDILEIPALSLDELQEAFYLAAKATQSHDESADSSNTRAGTRQVQHGVSCEPLPDSPQVDDKAGPCKESVVAKGPGQPSNAP
mmetsp:Transcript_19230/g.53619  ORF Transcript_19230/g.53619 Transcript_19230/m.53619 type:complete len:106 (+) Transcript_19230:176-493(+)